MRHFTRTTYKYNDNSLVTNQITEEWTEDNSPRVNIATAQSAMAPLSPDGVLHNRLSNLLNEVSRENDSDTPDWLLADFLMDSLRSYERIVTNRDSIRHAAQVPHA